MTTQLWVDLVGIVIGSGVITVLWNWLRERRTAPTDNTARLSDAAVKQVTSAMAQVDQLQEQAANATKAARDAETSAHDARREGDQLRRELRLATLAAERLEAKMNRMAELIHDPYMTIERLRTMVPPPAANGTAT